MRALLAAAVLAGCYSPHLATGSPCNSGPCPDGLVCSPATLTCELTAVPLDTAIVQPIDAAIDAKLVDAKLVDASIDAAGATLPVLLQQMTNHNDAGPTITATFTQTPVAGHVLVMIGGNPGNHLTMVTGAASTWQNQTFSTANVNVETWTAVADGSSASVTITLTGGDAPNTIWIGEWSGLVAPAVDDGDGIDAGTASPAEAMTVNTPALVRDVVFFAVNDGSPNTYGASPTPGTWTAATPIVSAKNNQSIWYQVTAPSTTLSPSVTETAHVWDATMLALRIAP